MHTHWGNNCCKAATCLQAAQPVFDSSSPLPDLAAEGDTTIVLDSGESLKAHSFHLTAASDVFKAALACNDLKAIQNELPDNTLATNNSRFPLLGASKKQACLLLHCLYSFKRESWARSLSSAALIELAAIAHKFACHDVLELVDSTLSDRCLAPPAHADHAYLAPLLTHIRAPEQYKAAQVLHLTQYTGHIGCYLGEHADEIDLAKVDEVSAHILKGAMRARIQLLKGMHPG